jgi:hypothetical protein
MGEQTHVSSIRQGSTEGTDDERAFGHLGQARSSPP